MKVWNENYNNVNFEEILFKINKPITNETLKNVYSK